MNAPKPYEGDAAATLRLWVVLSRAYHSLAEHARRDQESSGLGPTEFAVLEILYHKGRLSIGEVGARVLLTSGSMTYVIDKLERRGLLERSACDTDRRVCYVALTPEGEELMAEIFPRHIATLLEATAGLTTEEKGIAAALLKRLGLEAQARLG